MMAFESKIGLRIRVAAGVRMQDYLPGDEGSVILGPRRVQSGGGYFLIRMDRDGPDSAGVLFSEEEIEVLT